MLSFDVLSLYCFGRWCQQGVVKDFAVVSNTQMLLSSLPMLPDYIGRSHVVATNKGAEGQVLPLLGGSHLLYLHLRILHTLFVVRGFLIGR